MAWPIAFVGVQPERRHAAGRRIYGGLTLRNGVPIGYLQADLVGRSAALSFNTFDSFRGVEAAFTFARWLAALRRAVRQHLVQHRALPARPGTTTRRIDSGAWWFYAKLGFAPRDAARRGWPATSAARAAPIPAIAAGRTRCAGWPSGTCSSTSIRRAPLPLLSPAAMGLRCGAALSARAGADRERAVDEASAELLRLRGLASLARFVADQREAWRRLAPFSRCSTWPRGAWTSATRWWTWCVPRAAAASATSWRATRCIRGSTPSCAAVQARCYRLTGRATGAAHAAPQHTGRCGRHNRHMLPRPAGPTRRGCLIAAVPLPAVGTRAAAQDSALQQAMRRAEALRDEARACR